MASLSIDIVNIILSYVSDLTGSIVVTQYHPITNNEYYKINLKSDSLWRIKATLIMKRQYPLFITRNVDFNNKTYISLYKFGIPHYERQLRENEGYINKSIFSAFNK
jgi:hypothetical protein